MLIGLLFDTLYVALATNLLVTLACSPLVVVLLTTDPGRSWPLLAILAPLIGPALCGAFAVLAAYTIGKDNAAGRTFVRGWRASARRSMTLTAGASALLVVFAVDGRAAWRQPIGALAIPVLVVAMTLVVATTLLALVLLAERPGARVRDAGRVGLYLAVRHWYLTLPSLAMLALFEALLATRPAVALGLATAPLLYLVWAGSRFSLNPVLGPVPLTPAPVHPVSRTPLVSPTTPTRGLS